MIYQQWNSTDWQFREDLKTVLYSYLIEKGIQSPYFIRRKYAKLLVAIAKQDWPSQYPNFLNNLLELLKSEPNQMIGLILLRTTSEEFVGLSGRLNEYIPIMFQLLHTILENLGEFDA